MEHRSACPTSAAHSPVLPLLLALSPWQVQALSVDGRCKAFAADADGYGRGEGFATVVVEPLSGLNEGRQPVAIVAGSAVNQDGRSSGLTAPHGENSSALPLQQLETHGWLVMQVTATVILLQY